MTSGREGSGPRSRDTLSFQQDLIDRYEHNLLACVDCGRLILPGKAILYSAKGDGTVQTLCEPCHRLRRQIEVRIAEICNRPGGLPSERIYADLERFGVDRDLVEAARVRMHADGRLVSA
jgi:hypothetical protein